MRHLETLLLLVVPALSVGCTGGERAIPPEAVARAEEALRPFKQELVATLSAALEEGGPRAAIRVCRERAPEIAAAHGTDGVALGRTSHRLRSPANGAAPWMVSILADWLVAPGEAAPTATWVDATTVGYMEPLRAQPLCLTCHGSDLDPTLVEEIRSLYPDDEAVGFEVGDLRGAAWATVVVEG